MDQMSSNKNMNKTIQTFGRFLSGMVMPNIGAFIAWGLITALFIPTGWLPNEKLVTMVDPMIKYLLPILIGYTGGKIVHGSRGGVLGAIGTMGVIVGTNVTMLLGAMVMGPLSGFVIKKVDGFLEDKVPTGFEMLVNNFSAGIIGSGLSILAFLGVGPAVAHLSLGLGRGVEAIVDIGLLPLASILIEPAKVLFLNNAINHGVLSPLGIEQVAETGKSIFFLLEANPGPGLGILLAYFVFSKGAIKQSTPGAMIIHFLGGIHEIYFPYILMQPKLIFAVIAGGASGVFTFSILDAGLVATPSPGSIVAVMAMTPKGEIIPILLGVSISAAVTFFVASVLIDKKDKTVKPRHNKLENTDKIPRIIKLESTKLIVVACDAGMGSSAMGASKLRQAFLENEIDVKVENHAIENIPKETDIVITHESLAGRAAEEAPYGVHLTVSDFLITGIYKELVEMFKRQKAKKAPVTLAKSNIVLGLESMDKEAAIRMAGQVLFEGGYVEEEYIDAMVQRDQDLSTFIGNGTAIPHGVSDAKKKIMHTGISILTFPDGVDFDGNIVYLVVGIAGVGNEHLMILANLAEIVEDEEIVETIRQSKDVNYIYKLFTSK